MPSVSLVKTRERVRTGQCVCVMRVIEVPSLLLHSYLIFNYLNLITYTGNGVQGCTPGDCISLRHEMCPNNKACYDSTCVGN